MPQWNTVTKYKENDVTVEVDRRSWIYVNGIPMRYAVNVTLGADEGFYPERGSLSTRWGVFCGGCCDPVEKDEEPGRHLQVPFIAVQKHLVLGKEKQKQYDTDHMIQMPFSFAARSVSIYTPGQVQYGLKWLLGYLDDPRNTDNAWVETEVWNFHYDHGDTFDSSLPEWKEVSPYVKMFGNEGVIVKEAARIHEAYH
ncbi:hypothetical protein DPMN_159501 [Dreissena polymorpha]|uniref:Uncharacterized protein n=1 Tax=Dreissena polymorpha TaxID=45954 RepID=A0A9D4EJS9_DREPO|nr:hypothetical protein DPMN_159501 [Dreissena polymorpha]